MLFAASCFFQATARAQVKEVRRVLIFYELGLSSPGVGLVDQGIRTALQDSPYQIELYREYLETTLFPDPATQQEFRQWYVHKYRNLKPDLIIVAGPSPLRFLVDSHEKFFSGVPIVFCGTSEEQADRPQLDSDFTGIWEKMEPVKTLQTALLLEPGTTHVVVVGGTTSYDRHLVALVKNDLSSYYSTLDITYVTDLAMPQLLEKVKHLPSHTVVLLTDVAEDLTGTKYIGGTEGDPMVTAASNAPVFALADVDVGQGEVGGDVTSFAKEGQIAGAIVRRILNGDKPRDIPIVTGANVFMFDWRALQQWHLKETSLPSGSILLNRPPSFWELYWHYLIAGFLVLLVQSLAILALLWQRAKRRKAEGELVIAFDAVQESERRFRLVANTAPVMIWMSGPDKLCNYFNQPWLDFAGRSFKQECGNGWSHGVHPEDLSGCLKTYTQSFDRRETFNMQYRLRRHDGEFRWVFDTGVPRFNSDGSFAGYIGSCIDVTDRKRAEEALAAMGRKLIQAHEEERTWIARELHDDINQRLALVAVQMEATQQVTPHSVADLLRCIRAAQQGITDIAGDIQGLSHRLHSSKLEYLGIVAAAKGFFQELSEQKRVEIDFTHADIPQRVPKELSLCLFRVLQEAVQNAVKHSGVRHFKVELRGTSGELELTVRDSGVGFDQQEAVNRRGLGLISMRERVQLLDGEFSIRSEPGRGTKVFARVPLKSEEAPRTTAATR